MHIDYDSYYKQISALTFENNKQARGYAFEQIMREVLPWDIRPPISAIGHSEQHDAYFSWQGRDFLVESKAKEDEIKAGSHDWEDFELKVRKRNGQAIGIFTSLFNVAPSVFERAQQASFAGYYLVVIDGPIWEELAKNRVPLTDYINYVLAHLKTGNLPRPKKISDVKAYFEDAVRSRKHLIETLSPVSGRFLRRFKKDIHEATYLPRQIDSQIEERCRALKPSKIPLERVDSKEDRRRQRRVDEQVSVIRDVSGAGKTTLSVQLSLNQSKHYVCLCRTASDPNLDGLLEDLRSLGPNYGVQHLQVTDSVLVYVVDSLDEAEHLPDARRQVIALNRCLDALNYSARTAGLAAYPILVLYTVRDEYWRGWESVFEGLRVRYHTRWFSKFSNTEVHEAISKYGSAFGFRFNRRPNPLILEQLSSPFDLSVFSETFAHEGKISVDDVFTKSVLTTYFLRKSENLATRPIPGVSPEKTIQAGATLATAVSLQGLYEFTSDDVYEVFRQNTDLDLSVHEIVLDALISERILERVESSNVDLRFRHNKFSEYLVAADYAHKMISGDSEEILDQMISHAEKSNVLEVISLCDTFRTICNDQYPAHSARVSGFFSKSVPFLMRIAEKGRLQLTRGGETEPDDLEVLEKGLTTGDPKFAWESFFVFSAKPNSNQTKNRRAAFMQAWDLNLERGDKWKLIQRVWDRKLLLDEEVFRRALGSTEAEIWLHFLDRIIDLDCFDELQDIWRQLQGEALLNDHERQSRNQDWTRVRWVLQYALSGKPYPLGVGQLQ